MYLTRYKKDISVSFFLSAVGFLYGTRGTWPWRTTPPIFGPRRTSAYSRYLCIIEYVIKASTSTQDGMIDNCNNFYLVKRERGVNMLPRATISLPKPSSTGNPILATTARNQVGQSSTSVCTLLAFRRQVLRIPPQLRTGMAIPTPDLKIHDQEVLQALQVKDGDNFDKIAKC